MILVSAFLIIIIGLFNNFKTRIYVALIIIGLLPLFTSRKNRFYIILIITSFVLISYPIQKSYFECGQVIEIRDKYYLISSGIDKVILYTETKLSLDDKVWVDQKVKKINYYNNFNFSTYQDYCLANNISGTVSLKEVEIERPTFSFRRLIYEKCVNNSNKWILQLLFKNSLNVDSDKKFFLTQSSLHLSFFVGFLKSILMLFFYEEKSNIIVFILTFLLGLFFNFPYGYIRILISLALLLFIKDKKKKLAYEILLLAFYKPYYIKTISFLIPLGIRIISTFLKEKRLVFMYLYIIIIQLVFFSQIDLISTISFMFFKSIFGFVYLLALLVCFMPLNINLDSFLPQLIEKIDGLPKISLTGTFNLILIVIIIFLFLKYFETLKKKYLFMIMITLLINNNRLLFTPIYTITFLDVGQGDCSLVTSPFSNKGLLIDVAGNIYKDISKDIIIPYLNSLSIKSVDVIISHDDYDHSGGLASLKQNFNIKNIYTEKIEKIYFKNLEIYTLLHDENYDDINDNSLISYFKINQFHYLYLGDVSKDVEHKLIEKYDNLKVDVLKLSHHGSNSSTSEKLLSTYQIPLAIISAGRNNFYNHPAQEVIERLNQYGVFYLSTKESYGIRFYLFNHLLIYQTSIGQFGFLFK